MTYKELPSTRTDLGYDWIERPVDQTLADFGEYLKRNNARAFLQDVYATNDQVYRNIIIQLPGESEGFTPEDISIRFNRDKGRQLSLTLNS